ncbi:MAG: Holliday junction branch migration protein RuvA [Egibacteraceae bacterium]
MIALLRGTVVTRGAGEIVLDVGGVGYRVRVPAGTATGPIGAETTLHTYLAVREDALDLYGFADPATRGLFETLLSVTGVGCKLALAALGALGAEGLRRAVLAEDVRALTIIPGVGRKGAQRMILELRERLGAASSEGVPGNGAGPSGAPAGARDEVLQALLALGYAAGEVQQTIAALPDDPDAGPEELLRGALRNLAGKQR